MVDVALSFRSSGAVSAPALRADAVAPRLSTAPVATDLASAKTVVAVGNDEAARFEPSDRVSDQTRRNAAIASFVEHHSHYDSEARTVVYQAVNAATDEVVRQFPDDLVLKLRAYFNQIEKSETKSASDVPHVVAVNA